jgi:hypothetical protein
LLGGNGQKEKLDQYFARLDRELTSLADNPPARGDAPEATVAPHRPSRRCRAAVPPLADAFAALLAAEREDAPAGNTVWPASAAG